MDYYLLLTFVHLVAFVYWLGGDLGTFIASRQVVRRDIGVEARRVALKVMMACDQGPRLAMPVTFVVGYQMAATAGYLHSPGWLVAAVWVVGLAWFANVLILHHCEGRSFTKKLAAVDLRFRFVVIALILASAGYGLAGADYLVDQRIGWKMLVFAGLMGCGVMIRWHLRPFMPAFAALVADGPDDARNDAVEDSLRRCQPYVAGIWLGLFVNAALGVRLL